MWSELEIDEVMLAGSRASLIWQERQIPETSSYLRLEYTQTFRSDVMQLNACTNAYICL